MAEKASPKAKKTMEANQDIKPEKILAIADKLQKAKSEIHRVIFGQDHVIDQCLYAVLAHGHIIIEGLPGLAKTKLVQTVGAVMGLDMRRIQCTPELMPADIIGSEVLEDDGKGKKVFRFIQGPVFCQLLMADEINRASPRTQSALLQAMQEKQVSYMGKDYDVPRPFLVFATQNPIEQEGTYPLPEAQLDRFFMKIDIAYPDEKTEQEIMIRTTSEKEYKPKAILNAKEVEDFSDILREMPVGETIAKTALELIRQTRPETSTLENVQKYIAWGAGPRGGQFLLQAAKARALLEGRLSPSLDDLAAIAKPVLSHRIGVKFYAQSEGITRTSILDDLIEQVCGV